MRNIILALTMLPALSLSAVAVEPAGQAFDWDQWRRLPVQEGGRQKPFDTLAWETLRRTSNRASFGDPETGQKLSPIALYLTMLFEWQGWQQPADPHAATGLNSRGAYFQLHKPDKWDRAPLLRVDHLGLRKSLGMGDRQKHISPLQLSQAAFQDPHTGKKTPFLLWARRLVAQGTGYSAIEKKGLELSDKFLSYQSHRMGQRLEVVPVAGSEQHEWASVAYLMQTDFDDETDPTGGVRAAKEAFLRARAAYLAASPEEFDRAAAAFVAAVTEVGPKLGTYPTPKAIDLEVAYNRWVPFRFAWIFTLAAFLCLLLAMGTRWKSFSMLGVATYGAGLVAVCVGFGMRIGISGRAPVTNMYESVIYLGLGIAVFGLIFELFHRKKYILTAAAAVATVALILADNCPAVLDPSIRPLPPVLRNNFWLITHVMSITLSYAVFALALGIGNITLGYCLVGSENRNVISALSKFTYKSLQVGVLLLAIGTILGAVWADFAWGRFWGWDPKEVWALITLLGYLAVLHARYAGWVRSRGLAALSVVCFSLVVMAWYGVNYVLGTGLHSYGFGGGGQFYVFGTIAVQFLYVAIAVAVSVARESATHPQAQDGPREEDVRPARRIAG